jgi:hypothetical protein
MVNVTLIDPEEETTHKCSVCSFDYEEVDGGIEGYFGPLRVNFCPVCYSSMVDLVQYQEMINDEEEAPHTNH